MMEVQSVEMPVSSATDVWPRSSARSTSTTADFSALLPVARALREQVDWPSVREQMCDNDFAVVLPRSAGALGSSSTRRR